MWRLRLARELPRYLFYALALSGVAASIRTTLLPLRAPARPSVVPQARQDRAAEGFAALFARRYLTWEAAEPQASAQSLQPFVGGGMEADAGLQLPAGGRQDVQWCEVVQERIVGPGVRAYTVAVQTDAAGLLYLSVSVARTRAGSLALAGYPAFVGAPASGGARLDRGLGEVSDPALATVVERTLRNYLAGATSELAADLSGGARVSVPAIGLSLTSVRQLDWSGSEGSVAAVVQAQDARGVQYTLAYELDVVRAQGRWEVSAVQMDPTA
jgi:hypothetical protein